MLLACFDSKLSIVADLNTMGSAIWQPARRWPCLFFLFIFFANLSSMSGIVVWLPALC